MKRTVIRNYISPSELAILIRQNGGSAWVESDDNGREVVVTNRSMHWVRKTAKATGWIQP